MQPVNDDMDNLFRQAAANYPLPPHAPGFNFEQVRQQLEEGPSPARKQQRRRVWLLWLVLIGFVVEHHFHNVPGRKAKAAHPAAAAIAQMPVADSASAVAQPEAAANQSTVHRQEPGRVASEKPVPVNKTNQQATEDHTAANIKSPAAIRTPGYTEKPENRKQRRQRAVPDPTLQAGTVYNEKRRKEVNHSDRRSAGTSDKMILAGTREQLPVEPSVSIDSSWQRRVVQKTTNLLITDTLIQTYTIPADTTVADKQERNERDRTDTTLAGRRKNKEKAVMAKPGFYIGLLAGADWSMVKSSRTSSAGYNAGLLAGYGAGKHWVVQAGLLWNLKRYYADGRYVSVDKLNLRPHTEVIYIDGTCGMMELPLNIQYHFAYKRRHHWYAVAGVSSYLMKKENYYYAYRRYNQPYYGETTYRNASRNWFSVVQAGAGYQLSTGKKGSIRIEPYLKLPVARIGIAGLPLSSAGVNIGYILPLQ